MDMATKIKGLKLLVSNGILTDEECEKCIAAITAESTENALVSKSYIGSVVEESTYSDSNITVSFKGIDRVTNLFYGEGYQFKFVLQNHTQHIIKVYLKEVTVNGFVISSSELLCNEAAAGKKTIDFIGLYDSKLNDCDIYGSDDFESLEFRVHYEVQDTGYEYESRLVSIDPQDYL